MRISRTLALGASVLTLALVGATGVGAQSPSVRIGSDNFYESKLVAEIYAQALEAGGYTVERNLGLGTRQDRAPAFEAGQVDLVPEYVGSGLGYYDTTKISGDGEANRVALQAALAAKGIEATVLAISPGQDSNAFVVRQDTAASLSLSKMSQLAAVQDQLRWGLPSDCDVNPLCRGALEQYGITYPPAQREALEACSGPIAEALSGNAIDLAELCSTQPAIAQFGFVQLEDDLKTQPAENLAPLVRNDFLAKLTDAAGFQAILDGVSARITTEELTRMGVEVAVDNKDIADVAAEFLAMPVASPAPAESTAPAESPAASPAG